MSKMRVYEVARDLAMDNKSLVALFQSVGVTDVRNHMSAVLPEQVDRVKRHLERQSGQKAAEERIHPTVVKRRARVSEGASEPPLSVEREEPAPSVVRRPPAAPRSSPVASVAPPPTSEAPSVAPVARRAPVAEAAPVEAPPAPESAAPAVSAPAVSAPAVSAPAASAPAASAPAASAGVTGAAASAPAASAVEPAHAPPPAVHAPEPPSAAAHEAGAPAVQPVAAHASNGEVQQHVVERAAVVELPPTPIAAQVVAPPAPPPAPVAPAASAAPAPAVVRPRPKTGIEVWEGRAGVPMPQQPRSAAPRRVQYDAKSGVAPAGQARGPSRPGMSGGGNRMGGGGPGGAGRGGMRHRGIGSLAPRRTGGAPITQERSAHKKIVKIEDNVNLQTLAGKMGAKAGEVLMKLMSLGMTGVNINSNLDPETAKIVANEFGWEVEDVAVSEEDRLTAAQGVDEKVEGEELLEPRPPVVTVMGHVDHGKTSLLDYIRKTTVTEGEAGGITQHIGAYSVPTSRGSVTFLDTPGHAAFSQMRARGAQTTDLVILVVAADDGVMPQTKEAVTHAKAAKVPIVVAVNKIDKEGAQPERVRRELSEIGLVPEEWGGDTMFCECSALTGEGVEKLLENVALQAEILELRANKNKPASGVVIEAKLDRGQGPVATVLVQSGTLQRGDVVLAGSAYGKVRAMLDDRGKNTNSAGPSVPVAVIGLNDVPSAGDPVHILKSIKEAQDIAETRQHRERRSVMSSHKKVSLEELARRMSQADQLEVKLIIKADVQGSVEALSSALTDLSTDKVKVTIVHAAVGAITEGDVNLAIAAKAIVVGFNVRPAGKAGTLAQKEGIEIRQYRIIYDVTDDIRSTMEGLLAPTLVERLIGKAEVRQLFKLGKTSVIAGCMVTEGVIRRNSTARVLRKGELVWAGKIGSLKRFKDDAREVKEGFDCGLVFDGFTTAEEGDLIEAMETEEVRQTL
jgi:translation initiation factor IF-2